jgi:hypothetical protein
MDNAGILTIYALTDTAEQGYMPAEKLVAICQCFYSDRVIGYNRAYAALGADQRVDRLVRCYYTTLPEEGKYVIPEDGKQYRITLKQQIGDDCDITLERLETNYDVLTDTDDTDDSDDPSESTDDAQETI